MPTGQIHPFKGAWVQEIKTILIWVARSALKSESLKASWRVQLNKGKLKKEKIGVEGNLKSDKLLSYARIISLNFFYFF